MRRGEQLRFGVGGPGIEPREAHQAGDSVVVAGIGSGRRAVGRRGAQTNGCGQAFDTARLEHGLVDIAPQSQRGRK